MRQSDWEHAVRAPIRPGTARRLGLRQPLKWCRSEPLTAEQVAARWSCNCEACLDQKPWLRMGKLPPPTDEQTAEIERRWAALVGPGVGQRGIPPSPGTGYW